MLGMTLNQVRSPLPIRTTGFSVKKLGADVTKWPAAQLDRGHEGRYYAPSVPWDRHLLEKKQGSWSEMIKLGEMG